VVILEEKNMETESFVHLNPVWRDKANFIIGAKCPGNDVAVRKWEQLWSRQISENRFEICCIPFFVFDIALGDEVETGPEWGLPFMIQHVVKPSGHYTFRVWFGDTPNSVIRDEIISEIEKLGCLMEWYSINLLGVDASSEEHAQEVANYLWQRQQLGHLVYETGRTKPD
jgi:hypothetical protein